MEVRWRRAFHDGLLNDHDSLTDRERADLQLENVWKTAVKSYSCTNLTFDRDKLPALSGIANVMRAALNERYVAGLWVSSNGDLNSSQLPEQLGWKVVGSKKTNGSPSSRISTYCAPSWSWASVDGVIDMKDRTGQNRVYQASILSVNVMLEHEGSETGRVNAGSSISIRGQILTVPLARSPHNVGHLVWQPNPTAGIAWFRTAWCHAWLDDFSDVAADPASVGATALLLAYTTNLAPVEPPGTSGHGILIKAIPDVPGTYSRIGLLEFRSLSSRNWNQLLNSTDRLPRQEVVTLI
jgi:hypothetical protein